MKATKNLAGRARRRILSFINKNLDRNYNVVVKDWVAWTQPASFLKRQHQLVY